MKNHSLYEVQLNNQRVFTVSVTKADDNKLLCRIIKIGYENVQHRNGFQLNIPITGYDFDIHNSVRDSKEIENEIILQIKQNVIKSADLHEISLREITI